MPGITSSRIGTLNGNEIVEVGFDPAQTSLPALVKTLKSQNSFYSLIARNDAERDRLSKSVPKSDISVENEEPRFVEAKYTLRTQHPELYYLDLTETQAVVLNSWSYFGGGMPDVLTPAQKQLLPAIKARLSRQSPAGLHPARSGKGLEDYRQELMRWLRP